MKYNLKFKKFAETRGTYKFEEISVPGVAPIVGTLYIKKYAIPSTATHVTVVIVVDEKEALDPDLTS